MYFNLSDWSIETHYSKAIQLPALNLYNQNNSQFLHAIKLYSEGKYQEVIQTINAIEEDVDYNLLLASCYFQLNSINKALEFANKAIFICNSYHALFHYFGFNISINLYNSTRERKYLEKAEFLYKEGMKEDLTKWRNPMIDAIAGSFQKDLCIFSNSKVMMLASTREGLLQAFTESNLQHYSFHLSYALAHFIRGLCFLRFNKKEVANIEFEKAINMEPKNPMNSEFNKHKA